MVVLTWNEEANVGACLRSLAAQTCHDLEVLLIDAASTDHTLEVARHVAEDYPLPLRIVASERRIPVGVARNQGVRLSSAPCIAFLSADAEAEPRWAEEILASLRDADIVYGQQHHDPHDWTVGASVRGLRYHFPAEVTDDPYRYASNVSAGYRRQVLEEIAFDDRTAVDDLLLAAQARSAGWRAVYDPWMVVRHHDVPDARAELVKVRREAHGWADFASELGLFASVLLWGAAVAASLVLVAAVPSPVTLLLAAFVLWAPALRRAARRWRSMPPYALAKGVAASPLFDLAFLGAYLGALIARNDPQPYEPRPRET